MAIVSYCVVLYKLCFLSVLEVTLAYLLYLSWYAQLLTILHFQSGRISIQPHKSMKNNRFLKELSDKIEVSVISQYKVFDSN